MPSILLFDFKGRAPFLLLFFDFDFDFKKSDDDMHDFPTSPPLVWKHFQNLCAIPRPSGREEKVVLYVRDTAAALGLEHTIDKAGNIIVRKNASRGFEGRAGIVLQSHLDMVPQKNEGTAHDFLADPIEAYVAGEWMRARGTTLGADNGIGAALALAVLENANLTHGPIEALFTVDEEAGMTGAKGLEPGLLKGRAFINLDTEDEGEIYIGCAGGKDVEAAIPIKFAERVFDGESGARLLLSVTGLRGGHSGLDINLGRGNAIKILARCLQAGITDFGVMISSIRGGSVRNAIPREAFCELALPQSKAFMFMTYVNFYNHVMKSEYSEAEPDLSVSFEPSGGGAARFMSPQFQRGLIRALCKCPNGVIKMSGGAPDAVETSSNLAIVRTADAAVEVQFLVRSAVDAERDALAEKVKSSFYQSGAEVRAGGEYPGWKPDPNSRLLQAMKKTYNETFGEAPAVKVVHAGLECGIIAAKYPEMEFVSVGPTIKHPHSPDERLHIPSVEKFWNYLTAVLKREIF